jgi:hypothetical protein
MQVLPIDGLIKVKNTKEIVTEYGGETVTLTKYFDDRWDNMDLMYCLTVNGIEACVIKIDNIFGLPIITHYGTDPDNDGVYRQCTW